MLTQTKFPMNPLVHFVSILCLMLCVACGPQRESRDSDRQSDRRQQNDRDPRDNRNPFTPPSSPKPICPADAEQRVKDAGCRDNKCIKSVVGQKCYECVVLAQDCINQCSTEEHKNGTCCIKEKQKCIGK